MTMSPLTPLRTGHEAREHNGTRGNPRESRGRLRRAEEHPASQHDAADPAAQQGPSGHCDPPSATKRPFGRELRRPGTSADPKSASSSGSGPSASAAPRRIRSTLAPSTRPNECVHMMRGETWSSVRDPPARHQGQLERDPDDRRGSVRRSAAGWPGTRYQRAPRR
jgi:hypothetical protein